MRRRRPSDRLHACLAFLALVLSACPRASFGWDFAYDANFVPNDPLLGSAAWALHETSDVLAASDSSAEGGLLLLVDRRADQSILFTRDDMAPSGPQTIEARVRVVTADGPYIDLVAPLRFGGRLCYVGVWRDRIGVRYRGSNYFVYHPLDMSEFHVLRLAVQRGPVPSSEWTFTVWADGEQVFSGIPPGANYGNVYFGTNLIREFSSESYWDYVRYSREYVPVPEPSGLLALTSGLTGLLAMRRRRGAG